MTNKEAIRSELPSVVVNDDLIEKVLIDAEINGSDLYEASNGKAIARCTISVLQSALGAQDISEGGFSVSMRSTTIPLRIKALAKKWGLTDILKEMDPGLTFKSVW